MARQATGNDEQGVDADIVAGASIALGKLLGRRRDPAQPVPVEGEVGGRAGRALLDLDEGDDSPAPGNEVDFAAMHAHPLPKDPPAVEAKPPGGERLGAAAAALGSQAAQAPAPSSSARA